MSEFLPLDHDNEQGRQFYRSLTVPQRLPKKHRPDKQIHFGLFVDAAIGLYEDKVERDFAALDGEPDHVMAKGRETYVRELARITSAVDFISGIPIKEVAESIEDSKELKRIGALNYVLRTAAGAAKEVKDVMGDGVVARKSSSESRQRMDSCEVLEEHMDLEDLVKAMYQDRRIKNPDLARSMILLFELQKSTASPARQVEALYNARIELENKISRSASDEALQQDQTLALGVRYITRVIGEPRKRRGGLRLYQLNQEIRNSLRSPDGTSHQRIDDHMYSHIAYALEKLYQD